MDLIVIKKMLNIKKFMRNKNLQMEIREALNDEEEKFFLL